MPMIIKKDWLTIGEVSELTGVPIHTLRYWESEFDGYFSPLRTSGRQRRYDEEAVGRVLEIKTLLKEEKYSIAGARQVLSRKMDLGEALLGGFVQESQNQGLPAAMALSGPGNVN
ncbi:MAG: MerR family transcriptional regulator [Candidatus Adiutrix sp.]|nr:MerR family transcriptional regulator [Candidatus Adiutrix sp.]